jgi:fibronectin type 3 domain-containing protein
MGENQPVSGVVAKEDFVSKLASIRDLFAFTLAASLISGCSLGKDSTSAAPAPTPTPSAHSVALSWDPSPSTNLQGYKVYRGQVSGGPYGPISSTLTAGTQQFTDASVLSGQSYFYVVTSIDVNGLESGPSPEVSARIPTP